MKNTIVTLLFILILGPAFGQPLKELLRIAESNYPLLKAKAYEVQARKDNVSYVQGSALPSLDAAYQVNYATYNNITGMAVGESFVPISGPPSTDNTSNPVFGSAAGLLMNWEPFTFGQRKSRVESAKAYAEYQQADARLELFQHQVKTINAYLDVIMADALITVYAKNVERSTDNARIVRALTRNGLRPGTDTTLFNAELSRARIELYQHEKMKAAQAITLSEYLGGSTNYSVDSIFFKKLPSLAEDTSTQDHPLLRVSASRVQIGVQEKTALQRTMYPKLSFWGTAYARGSGIRYDGYVNAQDGLSFSRYNYGAGLILSVPLLQFTTLRHQVNAREALLKSEEEKLNLTSLQLDKQKEVASVTLANALRIAHESPAFYQSAQFSYRALKSRYNSGLVNYADFMQAQYALIKSEADLKRAYIEAWKALLYQAAIKGDISLFLDQLD